MNNTIEPPEWFKEIRERIEAVEFFYVACPHCDRQFFMETWTTDPGIVYISESGDTVGPVYEEPKEDETFSAYCPFCGKKITQIAFQKVTLDLAWWPPIEE